jgi:hypothetical protein
MADVQDYIDHVLADSPLLYWPLTGENANDVSGNAKHGTKQSGSVYEDVLPTPVSWEQCVRDPDPAAATLADICSTQGHWTRMLVPG